MKKLLAYVLDIASELHDEEEVQKNRFSQIKVDYIIWIPENTSRGTNLFHQSINLVRSIDAKSI